MKSKKLLPEDRIIFRIYTISITKTQRTSGINDIKFYFSFMERPKYCLYLSRLWPDGPLIRSRMAQWLALSLAVYFLWNLNRLKVYWFQICFTKWKWKWKSLSCVWLFVTPWTTQSMEFSRILEWVAFPFSRGSSQPRDQTQVSRTTGGFFTSWATREAQEYCSG